MSKSSQIRAAYGKAMHETNGNKAIAKAAAKQVEKDHWDRESAKIFSKHNDSLQNEYDFDSDINMNGQSWHTSEDL